MSNPTFPTPPLPRAGQQRAWWRAPASPSALAFHIAGAAAAHDGPLLAIARDNQTAQQLESDLRTLLGPAGTATGTAGVLPVMPGQPWLPVLHFPDWETLPYDHFSPHPEIVSQRLATLNRLPTLQRGIVVVPVQTLLQRLAPLRHMVGGSFDVRVGQRLDLGAEQRRLESAGYRHVPQVLDPGDFAVRGGLLDVYPMGAEQPFRVELLDDEIDTIRGFDPETQRSFDKIYAVHLLPGRELPLDEASLKHALDALRERFDLDTRRSALYQDLKAGIAPAGIEYYLPLFFEQTSTLFDYLADNTLPLLGEGAAEAANTFWRHTGERYEQRRHDLERPLLPPDALYLSPDALRERLNQGVRIEVCGEGHPQRERAQALASQPAPALPIAARDQIPAGELKSFLGSYPGRVLVAADSPGRREALLEILQAAGLQPDVLPDWPSFLPLSPAHPSGAAAEEGSLPRFAIAVAPFEDGFALTEPALAVLTERQLFPERASQPRRHRRAGREPEAIVRDLGELSEGAPIVHEDHGVGRYRGLVTLEAGGEKNEYLEIEYAKGDRLYVPVGQLHLINRYSGASVETAPLHSLGGEQWSKAKKKAQEKVRDVAAELLEIQAKRQARAGLAIDLDRAMYEPFAAAFPFEETPDQHAAIEAVLRDLQSSQPMDRVVCGDVGFGKTEVAVRAAFAMAAAGKQVAVLVPTTLLAEQHYRNFSDRFADWPLKVEVLSRFKTAKEIKA
ncbi:MAG TPA: CarD family transcriptional regulator, partial [Lysobacter sp.]|nr:CarD family transcriptional regulator [Lysobacter sp.]